MRVLCIARHHFLAEHVAALCTDAGGTCFTAVGGDAGLLAAVRQHPEVILCEVDLLVPDIVQCLENYAQADIPLLAFSLTRRQNEAPVAHGAPVSGYLYLPAMSRAELASALQAAAPLPAIAPPHAYRSPAAAAEPAPVA